SVGSKPAIGVVKPPNALVYVARLAGLDGMEPRLFCSLNIFGMENVCPSATPQALQGHPGEIQDALIQVFDLPVRPRIPCERRNAVYDQAKTLFACTQRLRGLSRPIDVQRVVYRQRNLVGDEREEADFL